jgi:hypothetical protein
MLAFLLKPPALLLEGLVLFVMAFIIHGHKKTSTWVTRWVAAPMMLVGGVLMFVGYCFLKI